MPPEERKPIEQIQTLRAQGYTDEQIVSILQAQGFSPTEIYDAFTALAPPAPEPMVPTAPALPTEEIERLVESIISERWEELRKELGKFVEWKDAVSARVDRIETTISDLKTDLSNLHKAILGKIADYDKALLDVGTEIKAMEKVFSQVLPEFTSSVQELSRIAKATKK